MEWESVLQLLHQYGYLLIIGWTFIEGETVVIIAGFLANSGVLDPWLIALCAFIGSFSSDQLMFSLGRYKGVAVLKRFPRLNKNSAKARRLINKYEIALALGFRFVYGVRNVTPILLGINGMKHSKFFMLNIIGGVVWALCFSFGGYYFGHLFDKYASHIKNAEMWLIAGVVAIILLVFIVRRFRKKSHSEMVDNMQTDGLEINTEQQQEHQ